MPARRRMDVYDRRRAQGCNSNEAEWNQMEPNASEWRVGAILATSSLPLKLPDASKRLM